MRCLVLGAGDIGSAVALRLRMAGHEVAIRDRAKPSHARRGMSFTDVLYEPVARLEGVLAKRASRLESLLKMLACGHAIPVCEFNVYEVLETIRPDVLVDARMHKHDEPDLISGQAPLTIGLGPGFVAGFTSDVVVETAWGDSLGKVIREGRASAYSGSPRSLGGAGRERYVYSQTSGMLRTRLPIGAAVTKGDLVAEIGEVAINAPLSGVLRGLSHDGALVTEGDKIIEVDPRGDPSACFGVGTRQDRIAIGVVEAALPASP